jgi:hypothetical protein
MIGGVSCEIPIHLSNRTDETLIVFEQFTSFAGRITYSIQFSISNDLKLSEHCTNETTEQEKVTFFYTWKIEYTID